MESREPPWKAIEKLFLTLEEAVEYAEKQISTGIRWG
jgi:hypothetical protein